jgi:hypothetical protein
MVFEKVSDPLGALIKAQINGFLICNENPIGGCGAS